MATRKERLKKLVGVQEQLKALHEMRRAGFLAEAAAPRARRPNCAGASTPRIRCRRCFPKSTTGASTRP